MFYQLMLKTRSFWHKGKEMDWSCVPKITMISLFNRSKHWSHLAASHLFIYVLSQMKILSRVVHMVTAFNIFL